MYTLKVEVRQSEFKKPQLKLYNICSMRIHYKDYSFNTKTALKNAEYTIQLIAKKGIHTYVSDIGLKDNCIQQNLGFNNDKVEDLQKQLANLDIVILVREPKYTLDKERERDQYGPAFEREQSRYYLRKDGLIIWYIFLLVIEELKKKEKEYIKKNRIHIDYSIVINLFKKGTKAIQELPIKVQRIYTIIFNCVKEVLHTFINKFINDTQYLCIFDIEPYMYMYLDTNQLWILHTFTNNSNTEIHCSYLNSFIEHSLEFIYSNERREKQCHAYILPDKSFFFRSETVNEYSCIKLSEQKLDKRTEHYYVDFNPLLMNPIMIEHIPVTASIEKLKHDFAIYVLHHSPIHNEINAIVTWLKKYNNRMYKQLAPTISINVSSKVYSNGKLKLSVSGRQYNPLCSINKAVRDEILKIEGLVDYEYFDLSGAVLEIAKAMNTTSYNIEEDIKGLLLQKDCKTIYGTPLSRDDLKPIAMRLFFEPNCNVAWSHFCFSYFKRNKEPILEKEVFETLYYDFQQLIGGTEEYRYTIFLIESLIELKTIYRIEQIDPKIKIANVYDAFFWDKKQISEKTVKNIIQRSANEVIDLINRMRESDADSLKELCVEPYKRIIGDYFD